MHNNVEGDEGALLKALREHPKVYMDVYLKIIAVDANLFFLREPALRSY